MKRILSALLIILVFISTSLQAATAAVTWSSRSATDSGFDGDYYKVQYDIEYTTAAIFDNDPKDLNVYVHFATVPTINMFNDSFDSFLQVSFDTDNDSKANLTIQFSERQLKTDLSGVPASVFTTSATGSTTWLNCEVEAFTNIRESSRWIGFSFDRTCFGLPNTFKMRAYAEYADELDLGAYDGTTWASITLPTSSNSSSSSSNSTASGVGSYALPENISNSSTTVSNFSEPPENLTNLSDSLLPSTVTVLCAAGSGSGWSAEVALSPALKTDGYKSVIVTNHHVIEDCISSGTVSISTSSNVRVAGVILAWNETKDVATVAIKSEIPALQWIGSQPKQGWWVGVIGSPLGRPGILTTGVISSVDNVGKTFTMTAPINPGNSGGPVFDSTGRVIGLATSKSVLSSGELAEGFGTAHGTPLMCETVIRCLVEKDPWGGTSKFLITTAGSKTTIEAAVTAQTQAETEARTAKDGQAKAEADAKAAKDAQAKAEADAKTSQTVSTQRESEAKAAAEAKAISEGQMIVFRDLVTSLNNQVSSLNSQVATLTKRINAICKVKPKPKRC